MSSCRWPRQRSTTVSEILCFAHPDETCPTCQGLPLWGSWRAQARLRGQGCCQTALHCDSIALTKSLLIAAQRLSGDGLALSVNFGATARVAAPSVCFAAARILLAAAPTAPPCFRHWRRSSPLLPKGEALAGRKAQKPPFGDGCSERGGVSGEVSNYQRIIAANQTSSGWRTSGQLAKFELRQSGELRQVGEQSILNYISSIL